MSIADPNKTILTGENPFVRLSLRDGIQLNRCELLADYLFRQLGPATSST